MDLEEAKRLARSGELYGAARDVGPVLLARIAELENETIAQRDTEDRRLALMVDLSYPAASARDAERRIAALEAVELAAVRLLSVGGSELKRRMPALVAELERALGLPGLDAAPPGTTDVGGGGLPRLGP